MPIYDYECKKHGEFSDFKSINDYKEPANCPVCEDSSPRIMTFRGHFLYTSVESPEYNPGLGCVVKNRKDRKQKADAMGLVEVGNEKPEDLRNRARRKKSEKIGKEYITGSELWKMADSMRK